VPELEKELEQVPAPESAHVAWRIGQCALRARDYARAVTSLESALAIDPSLTEANLDLARARYHAHDLDGADAALRAGESLSGEALWQLYRGMVDLGRGDAKAAVVALQRAVDINAATFQTRADPQAVEPVASYYLGLALRAAGEEDRARERLHAVADSWAGTDWASQANRALDRTSGRNAWLNLGAGLAWDSNVVQAGRDAPVADEISEKSDLLGLLLANAGVDLGRWGKNSAGVLASYRGRIHAIATSCASSTRTLPSASLWLDRALRDDTHVRFRYDFGYAWVDTDPFRISNGGRLSLIHSWSPLPPPSCSHARGSTTIGPRSTTFPTDPARRAATASVPPLRTPTAARRR
jgi:tetratricopeptide (TPR) repeat protein